MGERLARAEATTGGVYYPDLHGVYEFLYPTNLEEVIREEVFRQELTHIAEGFDLRQRSVRHLSYNDGQVYDSYSNRPLTTIAEEGLGVAEKQRETTGNPDYDLLIQRRQADIAIAEHANKFMCSADIGDTFLITTPYQEEVDASTASTVFGHWPERRRSFMWLGRKISADTLEWTDITIDQSKVGTFVKLLQESGVDVPSAVKSHELPNYIAQCESLQTDEDRDFFVRRLRQRYYELQGTEVVGGIDDPEALEFLNENARPLLSVSIAVQEAVAKSIQDGQMHPLLVQSAARALASLNRLTEGNRAHFESIVSGDALYERNYEAFATLARAQRYGIWAAMNSLVRQKQSLPQALKLHHTADLSVAQIVAQLDYMYANFNVAAAKGEPMPGCPGGVKFDLLNLSMNQAVEAIFGGDESSDWHGGKIHRNEKCQSCKIVKSEVGACHICHDCVRNPHKMEAAWRARDTTKITEAAGATVAEGLVELAEYLRKVAQKPGLITLKRNNP